MSLFDPDGLLIQALSAGPMGILVTNSAGTPVFANSRGQSLLGIKPYPSGASADGGSARMNPGVNGVAVLEGLPLRQIVESRQPVTGTQLTVTHGEGARSTLFASGYPLFGEAGRVDEVLFVIYGDMDDGRPECGMFRGEAGFRTVFENAPIGIVHFNSHGIITACNESNAQIFGAHRDKIVGMNLGKDLTDERMRAAYDTCRSGEIGRFEGEYVSVAGNKPIVARAAFVPLVSGAGSFSGGIELVEDITERRRIEDRLDWELKVNTAIARISGSLIAPSVTVEEVAAIVLEQLKEITGSGYGCIASVDKETGGIFTHRTDCAELSGERGEALDAAGYPALWNEAVGKGKAFYVNRPAGTASRGDGARGGPGPVRFLYVPAIYGDEQVGHVAIADSWRDYSEKDLGAAEKLAHLFTLSLQRKNVERKIERLASFPELNPYPIIELDFSGTVTYRNGATDETLGDLGCPPEPHLFLPSDLDEIVGGCRGEEPRRFYREVTIGESVFGLDIFRPSGLRVIRIYARDVTEKRHSEQALRAAHDLLETKVRGRTMELLAANEALDGAKALLEKVVVAVDQVEEGVAITNRSGLIEYMNPAFERLTGRKKEDLLGRAITDTAAGDARTALEEAISGGSSWSGRFSRTPSEGTGCEIEVSLSPVKDLSGRIINYVDVERDITRQMKVEAELHQTEKLEAISTLAGGIAHDFNNIIAGIIGFTEIMLEDVPEGSPMQRRLSLVLKGAHKGKTLVDQILSFSRKRKTGMKPVSLARVIDETAEALRPQLPASVELRRSITARESLMLGDYVQIHQMLANLCANAIYAMREQGGLLEIRLDRANHGEMVFPSPEEMRDGPWLELTVSDTGCGMEKSTAERVFEPFFTTRGPGEGTGMGLSVVHGIVRRHAGIISVESRPGEGSGFHLFFPEYEGNPEVETDGQAGIPGGTERILVVDDEVLITEMSKQRLERLGYTVATAAGVREAIDMLRNGPERFDLVITDYLMPEATGIDLAREVTRMRPDMPVILCSGFDEVVTEEDMKTLGAGDFFMKPINRREFALVVRRVLDRARGGT